MGKHGISSSTTSDSWNNNDELEAGNDEEEDFSSSGISNSKRSYGCIFCKRGFTNAQALGGHMNIHRRNRTNKDKPLLPNPMPKPVITASASLSPNYNYYHSIFMNNSSYFSPLSSIIDQEDRNFISGMEAAPNLMPMSNQSFGFECSSNNSSTNPDDVDDAYDFQHLWGSDLTMQIGSSSDIQFGKNRNRKRVWNSSDAVDLELRLGH